MIEHRIDKAIAVARKYVAKYRIYPADGLTLLGVGVLLGTGELLEEHFVTKRELKELFNKKQMDPKAIAGMTGLSLREVYRIVGGNLKRRHSPEIIKQVCDLKRQRVPNKYIVNRTGLDRKQVSDILKRYYETE